MTGSYKISVVNATTKYELTIKRNITIIKGNSATGKTVLVNLINDYVLHGSDSGISLSCDVPCRVINGDIWEDQLKMIHGSIVFIDEGNQFIISDDFAEYVKAGENYYVLVTRDHLHNLPFSVDEIYGIKTSGKYGGLEPVYHETYKIYEEYTHNLPIGDKISPDQIITEDTNSGYEFFSTVIESLNSSIICSTAGGKSNIFNCISASKDQSVLIIADGAAFGAEMERICDMIRSGSDIHLFLPESFEWLILNADIIKDIPRDEIEHAEEYADSAIYFSWERYFTRLLTQRTQNTHMAYSKAHLNNYYKQTAIINRILKNINGIDFNKSEV